MADGERPSETDDVALLVCVGVTLRVGVVVRVLERLGVGVAD